MAFHRLIEHELGGIILVNLHETVECGILPRRLQKSALRKIRRALEDIAPTVPVSELPDAFYSALRSALLKPAANYQVRGNIRPSLDITLTAIVGFDKIKGILDKLDQRTRRFERIINAIKARGAPDSTVAKAAGIINGYAARNSTISLSEWNTIFWAAPSDEIDRLTTECIAEFGTPTSAQIAGYLRDALGLVHLDFDWSDDERHIFIMRGHVPLHVIELEEDFVCARPTTFDGWDNRRFCQPVLVKPPMIDGCGMTINIARYRVGPGAAEVVSTPLPIKYFTCEYLGPVGESQIGRDADYYSYILDGRDPSALANRLTATAS